LFRVSEGDASVLDPPSGLLESGSGSGTTAELACFFSSGSGIACHCTTNNSLVDGGAQPQ
jgi:hypothetical protein